MAVEGLMEVTSGEGGTFRLEGAEEGTIGEGTLEEGTIRVDEEGAIGATKFVLFFVLCNTLLCFCKFFKLMSFVLYYCFVILH